MRIAVKMGNDILEVDDISVSEYENDLSKRALEVAYELSRLLIEKNRHPAPYDGDNDLPSGFGSLG